MSKEDWDTPTQPVLVMLASLYIHIEEVMESKEKLDWASVIGLMRNPAVKEWVDSIPDVLKPVKRSNED